MHETIVVTGLIVFNFVLLALAAAAGLFSIDVVFALALLLHAATAALYPMSALPPKADMCSSSAMSALGQ
jgi:hypothetical protein